MSIDGVLLGLRDALVERDVELRQAEVWDGAWDTLAESGTVSLSTPAALVSVVDFELAHLGHSTWPPGQLRDAGERADPTLPPDVVARLGVRIAVTVVTADPDRMDRARRAIVHAERAIPTMVAAAIVDIRGSNLYAPALYRRGLTAAALVGRRDVELAPEHPARQSPVRVDRRIGGSQSTEIWPAFAGIP